MKEKLKENKDFVCYEASKIELLTLIKAHMEIIEISFRKIRECFRDLEDIIEGEVTLISE